MLLTQKPLNKTDPILQLAIHLTIQLAIQLVINVYACVCYNINNRFTLRGDEWNFGQRDLHHALNSGTVVTLRGDECNFGQRQPATAPRKSKECRIHFVDFILW